jgi:hypothetical protein
MASNDNRRLMGGIAVPVNAPPKAGNLGGKKVTKVQRTLTEADPFDEIETFLTPERVEELSQPDPVTGIPVLVGDWTGKATRDKETGAVVPAKFTPPEEKKGHAKAAAAHGKDAK